MVRDLDRAGFARADVTLTNARYYAEGGLLRSGGTAYYEFRVHCDDLAKLPQLITFGCHLQHGGRDRPHRAIRREPVDAARAPPRIADLTDRRWQQSSLGNERSRKRFLLFKIDGGNDDEYSATCFRRSSFQLRLPSTPCPGPGRVPGLRATSASYS